MMLLDSGLLVLSNHLDCELSICSHSREAGKAYVYAKIYLH